jgi:hypothetical protein
MQRYYQTLLSTDDGEHSLSISTHWFDPEAIRLPPGGIDLSWFEGWLIANVGPGEINMRQLGRLNLLNDDAPQLPQGDRIWTLVEFEDLLTALLVAPAEAAHSIVTNYRDDLHALVAGTVAAAARSPRFSNIGEVPKELARAATNEALIPREQSDPSFGNLSSMAGVGGEAALAIAVVAGAVSPLALVVVPAGFIIFGIGRGGHRLIEKFVDRKTRKSDIEDLHDLKNRGLITDEQMQGAINTSLGIAPAKDQTGTQVSP